MRYFRNTLRTAGAGLMGMTVLATSANAIDIPLTFTNLGGAPGVPTTTAFRADLTGLGISEIASIKIVDSDSGVGGSPGIFSGFDLDAVFLDLDGDLTTSGDRTFGSSFLFSAGTTRPTGGNTAFEPNAAHPGPTFGSLNASTIDFATATLNVIDGISIPDVNSADGFLTLGDGGSLGVNVSPPVSIPSALYLLVGEVGTETGELVDANISVSDKPIPEPATIALLSLGAAGIAYQRRRRLTA